MFAVKYGRQQRNSVDRRDVESGHAVARKSVPVAHTAMPNDSRSGFGAFRAILISRAST